MLKIRVNVTKKSIVRRITEKQDDFLNFIENEMPFGKCILITHGGEPQRSEDVKPTRIFGKIRGKV